MLLIEQILLFTTFLLLLFYVYIKIIEAQRSTFSFGEIDLTTSQRLSNKRPLSTIIPSSDIPKISSTDKMNNESIFTSSDQPVGTSERRNRSDDQLHTNENRQVLEEQHKDYKEELQKSKRLYEKLFKGIDTKLTSNKRAESKSDLFSSVERSRKGEEQRSRSHKSFVRGNTFPQSFTSQSDVYDAASKSDISDVMNTAYIHSDHEDSKEGETGFKKKFDLFIKKLSQSSNESDLLKKVMVSGSCSSDSVGTKKDELGSNRASALSSIPQARDEDEDEEYDKYKDESFRSTTRRIDFSYEAERLFRGSSNSKGSSSSSSSSGQLRRFEV